MSERAIRRELANETKIWRWKPQENQIAMLLPDPSNLFYLKGVFMAPVGCPMEGYIYFLNIWYPTDYPFKPPKIQFKTPIWLSRVHPYEMGGGLCWSALGSKWYPHKLTLDTLLVSIQALFQVVMLEEVSDKYFNRIAAHQLQTDPDAFKKQAKEWAENHNEGYGIATLEDYFVSGNPVTPEGYSTHHPRVYCKKVNNQLWKAVNCCLSAC